MKPSDWEQYQQLVDLYRYYLDLIVKSVSVYWLITGGVLTLAFANSHEPDIKWALLLPIALSFLTAGGLVVLWPKSRELFTAIEALAIALRLRQRAHAEILPRTVAAFAIMLVLTGAALIVVLVLLFPGPNG